MIAAISHRGKEYRVDLEKPLDISIPLCEGEKSVNAFYLPDLKREAFTAGNFTGDVSKGGPCNVFTITFNPHGNGTHTETAGHIVAEEITLNQHLKKFFFIANLFSVLPEEINGDRVITKSLVMNRVSSDAEALIIRTMPNEASKLSARYSGSNPPFMNEEAAAFIRDLGIQHLLLDIPSIDREDDGGKLLAHRAFWNVPASPRKNSTITELIFVPAEIPDGTYLLNLQVASFENDASPSKPVLYRLL